ncbi:FmdB family zinc ribbon protein [Rubinisphaera italica]|uniref:FmdB family zinc ribbon protein n=1 Tax=Rubinisphaera italica TaxID=2527969 RepID=UPI0011B5F8EB
MPLFEYRCSDCQSQFELLIRSSQQPECPTCGKSNLEKLLSATAATAVSHSGLPIANSCPPSSAPACGSGCCRLPH